MTFVLHTSPNKDSTTRIVNKLTNLVNTNTSALLIGKMVVDYIGGKDTSKAAVEANKTSEFEHLIQIPLGINPNNLEKFTLYDILGLGNWADCADLEVIKRAYHKAVLLYHPDKQPFTSNGEEDRSVFLKVQLAYNTLCSEDKRRAYDSQLPFDESIPSDEAVAKAIAKGPEKYLKLYDKVFKRNARFAARKPVPVIGEVDTPIEQVMEFYDYWTNFDSWRDFTGVGAEHDPDSAGDRYERRMYEKENEKLARKLKQKEMNRIINLVTRSMANDPRIAMDKERKRLAKEQKAREKEEERLAKEAADKKAAEEAVVALENLKVNKAEKEKRRKIESKIRNNCKKLLRSLCERCCTGVFTFEGASSDAKKSEYGVFTYDEIEVILCTQCTFEEMSLINERLGDDAAVKDPSSIMAMSAEECAEILALVKATIAEGKVRGKPVAESSSTASSAGTAAAASANVERVWSRDSLSTLSKCIKKFPAGVPNRWTAIATEMNTLMKPAASAQYTMDECLKVANNIVKMLSSAK